MDPNSVLAKLLELAKGAERQIDSSDGIRPLEAVDALNELSESVLALDAWLRRGGFPPKAWERTGNLEYYCEACGQLRLWVQPVRPSTCGNCGSVALDIDQVGSERLTRRRAESEVEADDN